MTAKKSQSQKDSYPVELESKCPDRRKQVFMTDGFNRKKGKRKKERIRLADVDGLVEKYSETLLEIVG